MQIGQRLIPHAIDLDSTPLDITSDTAFFMKGIEVSWLTNTNAGGGGAGEIKPLESNYLYCSIRLPAFGENTVIGAYYFEEAVECYIVVHNTVGNHLVYRLEGLTGQCRVVHRFCTNLQGITADPLDYFSEARIAMKSLCRYLPDGSKELYKEMFLSNKKVPNLHIVIEDSIATNSFTTPFFNPLNGCCGDSCRLVKLGVPTPMDDIAITPIAATLADANKQNTIMNRMIKVRFRDENPWGQVSEHGKISEPYFVNLASCSKDSARLEHCLWLETKIPCPEIVRRTIEFQTCQLIGDTGGTDGGLFSDWKEYAVIELYDQTDPTLKWYDRVLKANNDEFEIYNSGKNIRFKFCNNRECKIISKKDIRDYNPLPINSGSVAALGKGILLADNENYFDRMSELDKKGFHFEVEKPVASCDMKYNRVVMYAVVHNVMDDQNNGVWPHNGRIGFGGFAPDATNDFEGRVMDDEPTSFNEDGGYGQFFPPGITGFRGILAGTSFRATSTQMYWTLDGGLVDYTFSTELGTVQDFMNGVRPNEKVLIQKFDFGIIPRGRYFFRILGHADAESSDIESTSTFYIGNYSWTGYRSAYLPGGLYSTPTNREKEILIDTTLNPYDGVENDVIAVIADCTQPSKNGGAGKGSQVVKGYLYEGRIGKQPIELANVNNDLRVDGGRDFFSSVLTDHNGFFFIGTPHKGDFAVKPRGLYKCGSEILAQTVKKQKEGTSSTVLYASDIWSDYATAACNRWWVSGLIKQCGSNAGIAGVPVILGRTKPVYSNSDGEFRVIAHYSEEQPRRTDVLILGNSGQCEILDCDCQPISNINVIIQPDCFNCGQGNHLAGLFNIRTIVSKGFEHGSRVPIGIMAHDWLGRHTDIQDMTDWIVQIPSEQELRSPQYPRIKVTLPTSFSAEFCRNFKYLTFFTGNNPDYSDFLTWAADKVEFVDSAGNVNAAGISKIKIWYRSLAEYNKLKGENTNTTWSVADAVIDEQKKQIISKDNEPIYRTTVADYVEFIQNSDGSYLPPRMQFPVEYGKDGTYFLIDHDVSLASITDGIKFKFKRPYACEQMHPYYEYAKTIYFCGNDCKPRDGEGNIITEMYLDGFNAYMLPRQIPVVTDVPAVGDTPATTIKSAKTYPFLFEHHSPSNTWGDHCWSGGRIGYKNPYEGKKCNRNQIMLSGALNDANDGAINYLHYFSMDDEFLLDEQGWGGINAVIVRGDQQLLIITPTTTFTLAYNDNRAQVTADGYIKVPINNKFSRPEKDDGFAFGCQVKDLNTLRRTGSVVMFLDSQKVAVVVHDFQTGRDVSKGIKSWLTPSVKKADTDRDIYFHACFDNRGSNIKYILTKYERSLKQVTNDLPDKNPEVNETVAFNLVEKKWEQMLHFTPEYYANMYGDIADTQFFSFVNGLPYAHHNAINPPTKYLNYYGIQCQPYIGVVANRENTKVKGYTSLEVYCFDQKFISEKVETSEGQLSKVLEPDFEFGEGFWVAPFMCDTNYVDANLPATANPIFDGDTLSGRWLKALFQPEPGYNGRFFLLTAIIIFMFPREKSSGGSSGGSQREE